MAGEGKPAERRYVPALTGIRGIAAIWVALAHYFNILGGSPYLPSLGTGAIVRSGQLGVDLFFILSGFVLMMTHGSRMRGTAWPPIRAFALGRIFRILPLNAAVLLILVACRLLWPDWNWGGGPFTISTFAASLLLVQSWVGNALAWNTPAWSLSAEWLAYVYFVVAAPVMNRFSAAWFAWGCAIGTFALLIAGLLLKPPVTLVHAETLGLVRCGTEFTIGMALQLIWRRHPKAPEWCFVLGVILLAGGLMIGNAEPLLVPAFALMIYCSAGKSVLATWAFGNPVSHFLGKISFSLYLINVMLFRFVVGTSSLMPDGLMHEGLLIWGALPGLIIASVLLYRWVELPSHRLGQRLAQRGVVYPD